jgi:hypothetical protein
VGCPGNGISNAAIDVLAENCPDLTYFTLSDSPLALDISPIVRTCTKLNRLSVIKCANLDSESLLNTIVSHGAALRDLDVSGCGVTAEKAVEFLMECKTLDSFVYKVE